MPSADSASVGNFPCGACRAPEVGASEAGMAFLVTAPPFVGMSCQSFLQSIATDCDSQATLTWAKPASGARGAPGSSLGHARVQMGVLAEAVDRRRPAQEITLNLVAAFLLQEAQFLVGLDAFGNDRQPEALAEAEHRPHDRRRLLVVMDRLDDGSVDLDTIKREVAPVGKRRITGAEIVHRDFHAERLDLTQRRQ